MDAEDEKKLNYRFDNLFECMGKLEKRIGRLEDILKQISENKGHS